MLETTKCPHLAHYPTSALSELSHLSLEQITLARWPVLSSWPWRCQTESIPELPQDCSLLAALSFSVHEGSHHQGLLLFPAPSLQAKLKWEEIAVTEAIVCGLICTEGKVYCAL